MMNPWVLGQIADQHLTELRADAAKARRVRRPRARHAWSIRLAWPVRRAVGCEL
jgi:hypothetical protein